MPVRLANTVVQPVGGNPIASAFGSIMNSMAGNIPTAQEQSVLDYNKARTAQLQQEMGVPNDLQRIVAGVYGAKPVTTTAEAPRPSADFQGPMPSETTTVQPPPVEDRMRAAMPELTRAMAAAGKPGDLAGLYLALTANAPGASTDTSKGPSSVDMAMLGKGEGYGNTIAGTREAQANSLAVANAKKDATQKAKDDEKMQGKQDFETLLSDMSGLYDKLDKGGNAVTEKNDFLTNKLNQAAGSEGVFGFGGATITKGSPAQNIRDEISAKRQLLFAKLKQAAGLSAQQLNSNVELMSYLKSLTEPTGSLESNRGIIRQLSTQFGTGGLAAPKGGSKKPAAGGNTQPSGLENMSDEDLMKLYQQQKSQ